jgi:hypothetical protein
MNSTTTTNFFKKIKKGAGASFLTLFRYSSRARSTSGLSPNFFVFFALFLMTLSGILVLVNFLHFLRIIFVLGFPL